ncbi:membrane fusion protein (multidrug efflux system) [Mucilaginibacter yixingensis]|uniref:Membrane fusion protein (Multidrug efflux system) n=1 Tax=Mucilaginibacter yixingensis TaxID=1295612 RepID=A0A2T5J6S1_9SPHI|nr:efflux RND transporter periplasmic adaptor subunit [Mucilaginibacter yixingensis]PTQ94855.1 membrane fusion protein (multidrug efflux system) [Mucilaginibacter yixingensis]
MKKIYLCIITPVAAMALASCGGNKSAQQNAALPPTPVSVATAREGEAVYYDQYQGTVVALNSVELRAQVSGYITGIFFKEGEVVQKGKPLYEIDRRKYQAAYDQAQANVVTAQANLVKAQKDIDRYNMLLKQDAVARQTVDNAEAVYAAAKSQVAVAKAGLESASTDLSYSVIKAPFTGRIGISQVKLGAQVTPGTTLLNTISSENPIGVDVVVNEQDISRFYKLQSHATDSTFRLVLSDNTIYNKPGKIFAIDRGVNNQTGTIKVRVQFDNSQDVLKDGMSAALKVLNDDSGHRVIIPYRAVTEQMGEFFVFKQQDTIALQKKITLGPRLKDSVVVMDGVTTGDKIITDGFQRLRDSGRVTLVDPSQLPAQGAASGKQGGAAGQQKKQ